MRYWQIQYQKQISLAIKSLLSLTLLVLVVLVGLEKRQIWDEISKAQTLRVIAYQSPAIYQPNDPDFPGFDFELISKFAKYHNLKLDLQHTTDFSEIQSALDLKQTHLALVSDISLSNPNNQFFNPLLQINYQVIGRDHAITKPEQLLNLKVAAIANSPGEAILKTWQQQWPQFTWQSLPISEKQLLIELEQKSVDAIVLNSNAFEFYEEFYPKLESLFDASQIEGSLWRFPNDQDNSLSEKLNQFNQNNNAFTQQLSERYFSHLDRGRYVDTSIFTRQIRTRLSRYEDLFKTHAQNVGMDWRLLAAISYQESHWRANAVSPTGVRGLMMLTRNTAKEMGFEDRIKPENSIAGGAKYFTTIQKRIPKRIEEPDRTWFALAAYNVGASHLEDARIITQQQGKSPDLWLNVKNYLPWLAIKKHYQKTKYGFARGKEPVVYVQNIRRYYDLLKWYFPEDSSEASQIHLPQININIPAGL